jgi:pimeloyl-ACP methyl ester carboxylesterase
MRAAGHDVFRLERAPQGDTVAAGVAAVVASTRDLRTRGYRRVVLAGQSAGGWISLAAVASAPGLAEAVIATAPAAYGSRTADPARAERNRDELLRILGSVRDTRVMLFFFDGDDFDPGGRGEAVAALLASRRVPHVLVDRPPSFRGHGIGLTSGFARRYGGCIVAFVEIADPARLACDAMPPAAVPWRFVGLPEALPAPANDNSPLGRFVGAWQGSLDNGDDVMLVVEGGSSTRVSALFARGRSRLTKADQAFSQRRTGRLDDATGDLVFDASQGLALRAAPPRDGALRFEVATADGKRQFSGLLKALSP